MDNIMHARPIRSYFDSQDNKINQKVSSSKTKNTDHYYIRTSHFNYLIKQIRFVQILRTDFQVFLIMCGLKITKMRCAGCEGIYTKLTNNTRSKTI